MNAFYTLALASLLLSSNSAPAAIKISLITVGPGADLFDSFGHSALLVEDSSNPDTSEVFEYQGVNARSFAAGNPMRNFGNLLEGKIRVPLSQNSAKGLRDRYEQRGDYREFTTDTLALTQKQAQALVAALKTEQASSGYAFEMFTANCATKIRDQIFTALERAARLAFDGKSSLTYKAIAMSAVDEAAAKNGSVKLPINAFVRGEANQKQAAEMMAGMGIPVDMKSGKDLDSALTKITPLMALTPISKSFKGVVEGEMTRSITEYEAIMTPKRLRDALAAVKNGGKRLLDRKKSQIEKAAAPK